MLVVGRGGGDESEGRKGGQACGPYRPVALLRITLGRKRIASASLLLEGRSKASPTSLHSIRSVETKTLTVCPARAVRVPQVRPKAPGVPIIPQAVPMKSRGERMLPITSSGPERKWLRAPKKPPLVGQAV